MPTATKPAAKRHASARDIDSTGELVLEFDFEKETPGTNRFKEADVPDGDRAAIGTLYITKKALAAMTGTKRLRVTIEGIG